jgi:hypothetical protein
MCNQIILMADVIDSRKLKGNIFMLQFKNTVNDANKSYKESIISPLTITLGDEFQGIVKSLKSAIDLILYIEEKIIKNKFEFRLRYVVVEGKIESSINKKIAYEMVGEGLSKARSNLNNMKQGKQSRFFIDIINADLTLILNKGLFLLDSHISHWRVRDFPLISEFLSVKDYKKVAEILGKDISLIWRREKSLKMKEYFVLKEMLTTIAGWKF